LQPAHLQEKETGRKKRRDHGDLDDVQQEGERRGEEKGEDGIAIDFLPVPFFSRVEGKPSDSASAEKKRRKGGGGRRGTRRSFPMPDIPDTMCKRKRGKKLLVILDEGEEKKKKKHPAPPLP